jgi:hypothetical protein
MNGSPQRLGKEVTEGLDDRVGGEEETAMKEGVAEGTPGVRCATPG